MVNFTPLMGFGWYLGGATRFHSVTDMSPRQSHGKQLFQASILWWMISLEMVSRALDLGLQIRWWSGHDFTWRLMVGPASTLNMAVSRLMVD